MLDAAHYVALSGLASVFFMIAVVGPISYTAVFGTGKRGRNARKVLAMLLRLRPPRDPPVEGGR